MSQEIKKIEVQKVNKVVNLSDRPNVTGGYGQAKLSAEELKKWFDCYADAVREKVDEILTAFSSKTTTEIIDNKSVDIAGNGNYIALDLRNDPDNNDNPTNIGDSLADLVSSIFSGALAARLVVDLAGSEGTPGTKTTLLACLEDLVSSVFSGKLASKLAVVITNSGNGAETKTNLQACLSDLVTSVFSGKFASNLAVKLASSQGGEEVKTNLQDCLKDMPKNISEHTSALNEHKGTLEAHGENISNLADALNEHKGTLEAHGKNISDLAAALDGLDKELTTINSLLENDDEELNSLKELIGWVEAHGADAEALVTRINSAHSKINTLNSGSQTEGSVDYKVKEALSKFVSAKTKEDSGIASVSLERKNPQGVYDKAIIHKIGGGSYPESDIIAEYESFFSTPFHPGFTACKTFSFSKPSQMPFTVLVIPSESVKASLKEIRYHSAEFGEDGSYWTTSPTPPNLVDNNPYMFTVSNAAYSAICLDFYCKDGTECITGNFEIVVLNGEQSNYPSFSDMQVKTSGVISKGKISKETLTSLSIPSQIQTLEGYGFGITPTKCNFLDFDKKVFYSKYFVEDDGTIAFLDDLNAIDVSDLLNSYSEHLEIAVEPGASLLFANDNSKNVVSFVSYVPEYIDKKLDKVETGGSNRLYGVNRSGEQSTYYMADQDLTSQAGRVAMFVSETYSGGNAPSGFMSARMPTKKYHTVPKKYVDEEITPIKTTLSENTKRIENLEGELLTTITDDAVAYEKLVPVEAAKYAVINKVGGYCKKELANNNLCSFDGVYELNGQDGLSFSTFLEQGDYYVCLEGSDLDIYMIEYMGDYGGGTARTPDGDTTYKTFSFTNECDQEVMLNLYSEYAYEGVEGTTEYMSGTITGIMLCKADDEDKSYKPYGVSLLPTKVTRIESYGANLFNPNCPTSIPSDTASATTTPRKFEPNTCIIGIARTNGYGPSQATLSNQTNKSFTVTSASGGFGVGFAFKLLPNTSYYLTYESDSSNLYVGYSFYDNDGNCTKDSLGTGTIGTLAFTTDDYGNVLITFAGKLSGMYFTIFNASLTRGTEPVPYKPFTAEPIAVYEIPEDIEGNGIGLSPTECNYFDFDRKVFVDEYQEVGGVVTKRESAIETPIAEHLNYEDYNFIEVEKAGSLVFVNEASEGVPSTVTYMAKKE